MRSKTLSMIFLSIPFALTAPAANAADRTEPQANTAGGTELKARTSQTKFLEPLALRFILSPDDPLRPQFCARLRDGTRCPPIISAGGIPNIDPAFTADLPNVRVTFIMQTIENEVIANGGVDDPFVFVDWKTTGTEADIENGGPYGWLLPGPGDPSPVGFGGDGMVIYDALVLNACGSFSPFPVKHESTLGEVESGEKIGSFVGSDNSTIDSTGFYNLNYTVRAKDSDGGVSDFHFSGKASVTCSALNALEE